MMSLPGEIQRAIPSVPGFDCDTALSADLAQQFFLQGYKFCLRYLSRERASPQDLTEQEAVDILNSGLALMPVQHANKQGWSPNQVFGQQDGERAAASTQTLGFPNGVSLWCDLEGASNSAQAQDVIDYCKAWYKAVSMAGFMPALYVGAGALLTGQQLYNLPFQHYWRSPSQVPDIPNRGYQLLQLSPSIRLNGVRIDLDVVNDDKKGGAAQWLRLNLLRTGIG